MFLYDFLTTLQLNPTDVRRDGCAGGALSKPWNAADVTV